MLKAALSRMTSEFSSATLLSGQHYYNSGHVLTIRLSDGLLRARVKGSSGQIYNVHIDLKTWPEVGSRCNCKYQFKCKHAAACFFSLQAKENLSVVKPLPDPQWGVLREQDSVPFHQDEVINADEFTWYSEYDERGHDFFAYQLGILIDGKPVSIVPLVVNLLRRLDSKTLDSMPDNKLMHLPIEQKKWIRIELGRIKPLLRLLMHYGLRENGTDSDDVEIRRYQLALMHEAEQALQATRSRWHGTEDIRNRLQQLGAVETLPIIQPPKGLHTQLRDYQHQGLNWLQFLKAQGFSGILADDMGLGKTIQTLAHLQFEKEQGNLQQASLIVAPTSLVGNWYEEARRFTPELKVLIFHGFDRHQGQFDGYDLVISTYGLVQRDKARFLAYSFYYLILDEAQFIKNARTKTTQIMQQLKAKHRLCLTGTPLENHLGELWSLFHFLMPGLLGDSKQFRQFFRIPIEKHGDMDRKKILNGRVQSFMLRRTKNQVMQELPAKTEITRMIELTGPQRDLYEAIRMTMEKKVRDAIAQQGLGKSQIVLLDALLKLRQVCCDPRLLSLPEASMAYEHSAKLDTLMELLDNLVEEGRRVLVFSQFTSMLRLIEDLLQKRQYPYFKLTGQTQNRQDLVNRFQAGEVPIFLISLKAGGTGLNLTAADTVILYDPWWNPAVQDQAASRSHRLGQNNPVFIYKLITSGTVEEAILDIQAKKRDLFDSVLTAQVTHEFGLSTTDIDAFFVPLTDAS
ncbi:MAG: DEAD/DEAH box helicase [Legionellaceae bacterium]|nr:DEAD/DEAH box helicase [Legionellaceae bacterium]